MSGKDGLLSNESNYVGVESIHNVENRAIYNQDITSNRHINSSGPILNDTGPLTNSSGYSINNAESIRNSSEPTMNSSSPILSSGPAMNNRPPVTNVGGPSINSSASLTSSSAPPINSNRSPMNTLGPQINSSRPPVNSNRSPLNVGGPPISSSGPPHTGGFPVSSGNSMSATGRPTNSGPPNNSNRSPMNIGRSPVSSHGPTNTGGLMNIGGPPMNSNRSSISATAPPISSSGQMNVGGPPTNNNRSSMNITGPLMSSTGPTNTSEPPITTGGPVNAGPLPMNISRSPMNIAGPPVNSSNASLSSNRSPLNSRGPPINSGIPPMNSNMPLTSSGMPPINSGMPPITGSRPPMNSGAPPLSNSGPTMNSVGAMMNSSGPLINSTGPIQNSTIPSSNRLDATQNLTQQFQNVNLSGPAQPQGYNSPNLMQPMNPQTHPTANMPPDMRQPSYTNSSPYNNQMNYQNMNIVKAGFDKIWGNDSIDLLQCRNVLPAEKVTPPRIKLHQELLDRVNCSPEIFRCTLTKIPDSNSLLQKSRLPLGILIHPFKDLNHLPVIQCSTIVRCRSCRTYINPFVYFVDSRRWKCNLCYKLNDLPEEFQFDPATRSYGDPSRRPEIRTSTIEFIAPSEYMLRPPQPAVYLFIFDVSKLAVESGYLNIVCNIVAEEMSRLPGDSRTQVGFLAVNSAIHFFSMQENVSQPHQMIMLDVDDVFLPCPENLIVNLKEREDLLKDLLSQLPYMFKDSYDTNCALGAALQAAFKLMSPTGGRVTVFQLCLPNIGPGALQAREDPNTRSGKDVPYLNPATDFYKRLALDCSGQQIAVDLFLLNCQYSDLATLSGICKFSGGCIYYLPLFQASKLQHVEALDKMLRRYLTRKIGFEAVMRIRCTRGLSIHTFHGNFFVRSTDLLSLPNINPDAGFGMQITIEENLSDMQTVCFQAALLYTSSKGERRIRVHTLCLPISSSLSDILYSADQQCIIGLLAKMAVDRSLQSSLSDAREALINAAVDALSTYKLLQSCPGSGLVTPHNLKLLPMYIMALLKCRAFRFGISTRLDDRVFAMCQLKTLPLTQLIQFIYPDMYPVHAYITKDIANEIDGELPLPERLHLSAEKLDSRGAFLLDAGDQMLLYIGKNIHPSFCYNVLGVNSFAAIPEEMWGLPELTTPESERLRTFIATLQDEKPYYATLQIIRDDGHFRNLFTERLVEDRLENALSYHEFLQHVKAQIK